MSFGNYQNTQFSTNQSSNLRNWKCSIECRGLRLSSQGTMARLQPQSITSRKLGIQLSLTSQKLFTPSVIYRSLLSAPRVDEQRLHSSQLQSARHHFSTSTYKMSDSNNNFLLNNVFNVVGKVRSLLGVENHQELTHLGRTRDRWWKWNRLDGHSSSGSQWSQSLHRRPD